jgi:hypothetical protein
MFDWRSFSLLYMLMRFGSRNEEMMDDVAWQDRDEPESEECEVDFSDLREKQVALLVGIAHMLQSSSDPTEN